MADNPISLDLMANDRGRARYFHGRARIINRFNRLCQNALVDKGGTIFLIQGSPGAGKTALLHELSARAARQRWLVVRITRSALESPAVMMQAIGKAYKTQSSARRRFGLPWAKFEWERAQSGLQTVELVLQRVKTSGRGLLLRIDEAQKLARTSGKQAEDALESIHEGGLGRPVILLAGGLGLTEQAFDALGVSRFHEDCLIYLGRLSTESERAVIRDWLVKGGKARGDVGPWIDAIAKESDGWPQHIVSFADPASQVIRQSGGTMTPQGLGLVLSEGRRRKTRYYAHRCKGLEWDDQALLGALVYHGGKGRVWPIRSIDHLFDIRRQSSGASGIDVKNTALAKGVLATTRKGLHIPIPSMEDWLVGCYLECMRGPPVEAKTLAVYVEEILPQLGVSTKALPPAPDTGHQGPSQGLTSGFGSPEDGIER